MSIKHFTAATAHDAMKEVRNAFGRDAIIISNRSTVDGIEIVATDNLDDLQSSATDSVQAQTTAPADKKVKSARSKSSARKKAAASANTSDIDEEAHNQSTLREAVLRQEIADLQGAVQGLATSGSVANGAHWAEITLAGRLTGLGLGNALVQQLIAQARPIVKVDAAWNHTLKNLKKQLRFTPGDFTTGGGTYVFHGPCGAGKTTTICKLAAQFLTENTVGKLAIVSAGANTGIEQKDGMLRAFSQLLNIPVHQADTPSELRHVISGLRRKKLVLIDTPAFNVNQLLPFGESTGQLSSKKKIEHCLVLSACTQGSLLDHTLACLAESAIESVVLTQLDQTRQIGTAIDCVLRSGLQLRYCSDSANLHDKLLENTPQALINLLANGNQMQQLSPNGKMSVAIDYGSVANWLEPAILV
ncbi:MAG: hypothetical protein AAF404_10130 [Pseudomonadota bacterium]